MIQRVEGGTTTNYTWDRWDLIKEVKSGSVNETTNYIVPRGEILAFERGGDFFYLHGDGLSSTQLVTDENGDQVGRFIYGAWGEELYASESVPGILESRFVGGFGCRKDAATGLTYMRHRWYDCQLQRFISRDPIGLKGGDNLYSYAESNPATFIDEYGLIPGRRPGSRRPGQSSPMRSPFGRPQGVKPHQYSPPQERIMEEAPPWVPPQFPKGWKTWETVVTVGRTGGCQDRSECTTLQIACTKYCDLSLVYMTFDAFEDQHCRIGCAEIGRMCEVSGYWPRRPLYPQKQSPTYRMRHGF